MASKIKSSNVKRFKKVLAALPKNKEHSARNDEAFELLERLVQMQRKQYVITPYTSSSTA